VSLLTETDQHSVLNRLNRTNEWLFDALSGLNTSSLRHMAADQAIVTVADSIQAMRGLIDDLIYRNQAAIAVQMQAAEQRAGEALEFAIVLTVGTIVITVLLALLIARTIIGPIRALKRGAARVARGSFDPVVVRSHDETAELASAFNDMSDQLRRMNEYKAEMMQHITHELRTPLQSLQSVYYLLSEQIAGPVNEKQRKYLEMLRSNAERITQFTNQFLDLAKLEAGKMVFHREPTELRSLLSGAVENARAVAAQNNITITLDGEELPRIQVDPEKISQVVGNLLSNAVKYTPDGGSVKVSLGSSGRLVRLSVSDTGAGIDPEDVPHLFEKFYQAKNVGKARSKGTGLGLALVKAIVEGHGGTIRVHSSIGQGTTVIVDLPAGEIRVAAPEGAAA